MARPRLIALDLDGTLLDDERRVGPRAAEAIAGLVASGVRVVLATGRPPRMTREYLHDLALQHALVFNGASRYEAAEDRLVHHHQLSRDDALEIVRRLREELPAIAIGLETAHGWFLDAVLEDRRRRHPILAATAAPDGVGPVEDFVQDGVIKIFARHPERDAPGMADALRGAVDVYATWTDLRLLEILHPRVNKRDALARFAAEQGIERDAVVAFGDQQNDVEMLAWAGLGVAPANAGDAARAAADEITTSNNDDGVARVLERWLP